MSKYDKWDFPNKTVLRREQKSGEFTTVNYKLLRDKRITSTAKLLMIEILSDSDGFRFSEQLYINRLNISKSTYYRAINNLIKHGYIRKKKILKTKYNYYTVSEFGNLNSKQEDLPNDSSESVKTTSEKPKEKNKLSNEEFQTKVLSFLGRYTDFITPEIEDEFDLMLSNNCDFYQLKTALTKSIKRVKTNHFKEIKAFIEQTSAYLPKDKIIAIKLLKEDVFDKNIRQTDKFKLLKIASRINNRKKPLDRESLDADRRDGV